MAINVKRKLPYFYSICPYIICLPDDGPWAVAEPVECRLVSQ